MSDPKIPRCDPKWDYKPPTSRENIEYHKQNPNLEQIRKVLLERYKTVRQHDKCIGSKHDWASYCRRCTDSDIFERMIALIEVLVGDDGSTS